MATRLLTAADAGRELGLTSAGTRWLAMTGRLRVVARTRGGIRLFSLRDVERLRQVRSGEKTSARKQVLA